MILQGIYREKFYWAHNSLPFQNINIISVRLCGSQIPLESIVSTGSRMLLMYKTSEHSLPHTGFLATYEGNFDGNDIFYAI